MASDERVRAMVERSAYLCANPRETMRDGLGVGGPAEIGAALRELIAARPVVEAAAMVEPVRHLVVGNDDYQPNASARLAALQDTVTAYLAAVQGEERDV